MTAPLPAGLGGWATSLAPLVPELSAALLPLVRGLDLLLTDAEQASWDVGEPDGFDGVRTGGPPERLLLSEWLLAEEAPREFLRRASVGELMHLAPARVRPRRSGRVVVLVDAGPDQLGAPRLVQLAALLVLHRRAAAAGGGLALGLLDQEPGRLQEDNLGRLLPAWRRHRAAERPAADDVAAWAAATTDDTWVLTGPALAAALPGRPRVVEVREGAWAEGGLVDVDVRVGSARAVLPLPPSPLGVRALRGTAFRPVGPVAPAVPAGALHAPAFAGAERRLLLRGDGPCVLHAVTVPEHPGVDVKIRTHSLPGEVLAAASLRRRLLVLLRTDDDVRVHVVGKPLWGLDRVRASATELGLTDPDQQGPVPALFASEGQVVVALEGRWWRLDEERAVLLELLAAAPGRQQDRHVLVGLRSSLLVRTVAVGDEAVAAVAGGPGWHAWDDGGQVWRVARGGTPLSTLPVPDADVVGLVDLEGRPALLTLSASGHLLRLTSELGTRTLTRCSGGQGRPALHPVLPLLAVQRSATVEVVDLAHDTTVLVLRRQP